MSFISWDTGSRFCWTGSAGVLGDFERWSFDPNTRRVEEAAKDVDVRVIESETLQLAPGPCDTASSSTVSNDFQEILHEDRRGVFRQDSLSIPLSDLADMELNREQSEVDAAIERYGLDREEPGATILWFDEEWVDQEDDKQWMGERFDKIDEGYKDYIVRRSRQSPGNQNFQKFAALDKVYSAWIDKRRSPFSIIVWWGKWKGHEFRLIHRSKYRWRWYITKGDPQYRPRLLEIEQRWERWRASRPRKTPKEKRVVGLQMNKRGQKLGPWDEIPVDVGQYESDEGFVVFTESEDEDQDEGLEDTGSQSSHGINGEWRSSEDESANEAGDEDNDSHMEGVEEDMVGHVYGNMESDSMDDDEDMPSLEDLVRNSRTQQEVVSPLRAKHHERERPRSAERVGSSDSDPDLDSESNQTLTRKGGDGISTLISRNGFTSYSGHNSDNDIFTSAQKNNDTPFRRRLFSGKEFKDAQWNRTRRSSSDTEAEPDVEDTTPTRQWTRGGEETYTSPCHPILQTPSRAMSRSSAKTLSNEDSDATIMSWRACNTTPRKRLISRAEAKTSPRSSLRNRRGSDPFTSDNSTILTPTRYKTSARGTPTPAGESKEDAIDVETLSDEIITPSRKSKRGKPQPEPSRLATPSRSPLKRKRSLSVSPEAVQEPVIILGSEVEDSEGPEASTDSDDECLVPLRLLKTPSKNKDETILESEKEDSEAEEESRDTDDECLVHPRLLKTPSKDTAKIRKRSGMFM
ncbi:uncharacterized protein PAC_11867 [Phialocephala subalpina]|uniref:Uncharacterized protein n=1 Tax=Phialocephala subalpina TaxID=576137 RepID=A0A1L7XAB1_9HELO|nr:uncharacterized protein PAC_11867 [Phialocephala subalpina]